MSGADNLLQIAQLRGVRLAINSEVPPSASFDEELVKMLTGESRLKARYIGKDFIWFENTATHFLAANHLPAVRVGGKGFWRRTRKVDFTNTLLIAQENEHLVTQILAAEGPGILQWIIDGAREVLANGLRDPEQVIIATREYQLEEDAMARFIETHLEVSEGLDVSRETAYAVYREWVQRQGQMPLQYIKFCREITQILPTANIGTREVFTNLKLTSSWGASTPAQPEWWDGS